MRGLTTIFYDFFSFCFLAVIKTTHDNSISQPVPLVSVVPVIDAEHKSLQIQLREIEFRPHDKTQYVRM